MNKYETHQLTKEKPRVGFRFKPAIGDTVILRPDSVFYGNGMNPGETRGEIIQFRPDARLTIRVCWSNGWTNTYNSTDLYVLIRGVIEEYQD